MNRDGKDVCECVYKASIYFCFHKVQQLLVRQQKLGCRFSLRFPAVQSTDQFWGGLIFKVVGFQFYFKVLPPRNWNSGTWKLIKLKWINSSLWLIKQSTFSRKAKTTEVCKKTFQHSSSLRVKNVCFFLNILNWMTIILIINRKTSSSLISKTKFIQCLVFIILMPPSGKKNQLQSGAQKGQERWIWQQ